jgi:serine O-acetyltransferase
MKPSLARKILLRVHLSMHRYVRNAYGIEIYSTARIGRGVIIGHQSGIVIHEFATIGDDCLIRQGVTMGLARGHKKAPSPENAPTIGDRVDIGAGAVIVGPVKIGDDVRIFPNAVVLTNVPSRTTVMAPTSRLISMAEPSAPPPSAPETTQ